MKQVFLDKLPNSDANPLVALAVYNMEKLIAQTNWLMHLPRTKRGKIAYSYCKKGHAITFVRSEDANAFVLIFGKGKDRE